MGDIENWMDESFIKSIFSSIAKVVQVKVMKKLNQPVGYAFVEFQSPDVATYILENYNGKTVQGNKVLKLSKAVHGSKNSSSIGGSTTSNLGGEHQIYVSEMDLTVTEDELKNFFAKKYYSVSNTKIVVDPKTRLSKGYGFVRFKDPNEANKALIEMNGKLLKDKPIKVK